MHRIKTLQNTSSKLFLGAATLLCILGFSQVAEAASHEALLVSMSGSGQLTMEPGERKEITVEFLNKSDYTWQNDGPGYLSVYTYVPKYRASDFDPGTWLGPGHVKRIGQSSVAPGEKATVTFELHAPQTEGEYSEEFKLASEDISWINGGSFAIDINVTSEIKEAVAESAQPASETEEPSSETNDAEGYDGELTVRSANKIKTKAGTSILYTVGFKNTGTKTWTSYSVDEPGDVAIASTGADFTHTSWTGTQLAYAGGQSIAPGGMAIASFAFTAPEVNGDHTATFQFTANGIALEDLIDIPVEVTGGSEAAITAPEIISDDGYAIKDKHEEPEAFRVGVLIVDDETSWQVVITSDESDFDLRDTNGNILANLEKGDEVTAFYKNSRYYYNVGRGIEESTYGLRFIPGEENAVMKIANFDWRETRNAGYAFNTYRNILELRYNDYKDRTWVINELPIEYYVKGMAETSDLSHSEFQKVLSTAFRTYAFYHYTHGTKRGKEFMHVISTADDQVYRGYEQEAVSPRIVAGVEETRGVIATYDNDIAITPYFTVSDGRTRDWSEVWNGSVAWVKSVDVPCDEGKTLWGHGVGLSAQGALCMANDGMAWDDILKHFYQGIELQRWWE